MEDSGLRSQVMRVPLAFKYIITVLISGLVGFAYFKWGTLVLPAMMGLPLLAGLILMLFLRPDAGIVISITMGFFLSFFMRYISNVVPYGLLIESLVVLIYLALFLRHYKHLSFRLAANQVVLMLSIWMFYILLQIANPLSPSVTAWFYAMRGNGLIPLMMVTLVLVIFNSDKHWKLFLKLWIGLSIFAFLWAFKQKNLGLTAVDQAWLDNGGKTTHILFGKLRAFSIHSDAGTFGASMAHICTVCFVLFLGPYTKRLKVVYLLLATLFFYGLMLSGTRGALAIPAGGGLLYLIMVKNYKYILIAAAVLSLGFVFLKFTTIGNGTYEIYRLRSALNPNDPSLLVRLENRERLSRYLEGKPFGGGLGTTGRMGTRFAPNTWLASFPPDGLYTRIRAETGTVGHKLFLFVFIYILWRGMLIVWRLKSERYHNIGLALLAGYAGVLLSNYGNDVMTAYPNNMFTYVSLGILFSMQYWNKDGVPELKGELTPVAGHLQPPIPSWEKDSAKADVGSGQS